MRVSVTIAGGVSMGTFEAGAIQEVLLALARKDPGTHTVDVLTGASAGSMTAAMTALELREGGERYARGDEAFLRGSRLYRAWVELADWQRLIAVADDPDTILGDKALLEIARQTLVSLGGTPHPAKPNAIRIGMALNNLNGIPYTLSNAVRQGPEKPLGSYRYMTVFHRDKIAFDLDMNATWPLDPVRDAALASGAFPIAFPHRILQRALGDYLGSDLCPPPQGVTQHAFAYSDGGIFDNEPLGFARDLATPIDEGLSLSGTYDPAKDRLYILIDPNVGGQDSYPTYGLEGDRRKSVPLLEAFLHLVTVVEEQAAVRDWIKTIKTNNQLSWTYEALKALVPLVQITPAALPSMQAAATAIATKRWPALDQNGIAARVKREVALWQAWLQTNEATDSVAQGGWGIPIRGAGGAIDPQLRDAWAHALFVFELGTGLRGKEEMRTLYINPGEKFLLHGQQLAAFGGFFKREWREQDYQAGRYAARAALNEVPELRGYENAVDGLGALSPLPVPIAGQDPLPADAVDGLAGLVVQRLGPLIDTIVQNDHLFDGWDWFNREERKVVQKILKSIVKSALLKRAAQ